MVEQSAVNRWVVGSSPTSGAIFPGSPTVRNPFPPERAPSCPVGHRFQPVTENRPRSRQINRISRCQYAQKGLGMVSDQARAADGYRRSNGKSEISRQPSAFRTKASSDLHAPKDSRPHCHPNSPPRLQPAESPHEVQNETRRNSGGRNTTTANGNGAAVTLLPNRRRPRISLTSPRITYSCHHRVSVRAGKRQTTTAPCREDS